MRVWFEDANGVVLSHVVEGKPTETVTLVETRAGSGQELYLCTDGYKRLLVQNKSIENRFRDQGETGCIIPGEWKDVPAPVVTDDTGPLWRES